MRATAAQAEGWGECVDLGESVDSAEYVDGAQAVLAHLAKLDWDAGFPTSRASYNRRRPDRIDGGLDPAPHRRRGQLWACSIPRNCTLTEWLKRWFGHCLGVIVVVELPARQV